MSTTQYYAGMGNLSCFIISCCKFISSRYLSVYHILTNDHTHTHTLTERITPGMPLKLISRLGASLSNYYEKQIEVLLFFKKIAKEKSMNDFITNVIVSKEEAIYCHHHLGLSVKIKVYI